MLPAVRRALAVAIAAPTLVAGTSQATVIITADQVGPDVVFQMAGSLDLTGMLLAGPYESTLTAFVVPVAGSFAFGPTPAVADLYILDDHLSFGPGGITEATSQTGGVLAVAEVGENAFLGLPESYISGSPLEGTMTFSGETMASMGMNPGTYTWFLPNDEIVMSIVPEPSTGFLIAAGLVGIAARRKRLS